MQSLKVAKRDVFHLEINLMPDEKLLKEAKKVAIIDTELKKWLV